MRNDEFPNIDKLVMQEINRGSVLDKYVNQEINRVLEEIKAEIRHFMFEVNPSSSESDYACNYILDLIDKKMGKDEEELDFPPHKKIPVNLTITKISGKDRK